MVEEPSKCEIHGVAFTRLVRKIVAVEQYNELTKSYEPSDRPVPKRFPEMEYLCELCDGI